jgi:hypothetical protein
LLEFAHTRPHRGAATASAPPGPQQRDLRLDVFRGLALVMIYVNHVPGTVFVHFTSLNYGFSDAAEAFVLMSGIAAGIAYSATVAPGRPWFNARRAWARSRTLYTTHIVITMFAIGVSCAAALWLGVPMTERNNLAPRCVRRWAPAARDWSASCSANACCWPCLPALPAYRWRC